MIRTSVAIFFSLLLTAGICAQNPTPFPTPGDDEVVKITSNLIQLDVNVVDRSGKPVRDLRRDEIEIYENGERQEITNFSFVAGSSVTEKKINSSAAPAQSSIPKAVESPKSGTTRRTIALVVDDLTLSYESTNRVRKALKKFIEEQMQDGDLVTIIRTGASSGVLQQFTSDRRLLLASVETVRFNPLGRGRIGAFEQITDVPGSLKDPKYGGGDSSEEEQFKNAMEDFRESVYGSGTLGTLKFMVSAMQELPGRKSVLLFSDGFSVFERDEHGYTQGGKVVAILRNLVDAANRASVVFYTVDARTIQDTGIGTADSVSLPGTITRSNLRIAQVETQRTKELFDTQGGLDFLAKETGGLSIKNQNDIGDGLEKMMIDQSYYLIGYQPDSETFDAKKNKYNNIEIKIKRDGAIARYRSGFAAISDDDLKPKTVAVNKASQLERAIISPFTTSKIGLRFNAIYGNGSSGNYVTPLLNINARDLKFTDGPDGTKRVVLDILAMSFGADGVPIDRHSQTATVDVKQETLDKILKSGLPFNFNFPVKNPGGYQFRIAVRDKQSENIGTASRFVEIPDLKKGRLALSGILLENFTSAQWAKFSGEIRNASSSRDLSKSDDATDPMNDSSHRRFGRDTILRYGFEIYNGGSGDGKKQLFTRMKVFQDGRQILEGPEVPVDMAGQSDMKRIRAGGAINLPREMPVGEYILQVTVSDGAGKNARQSAMQYVEFEVVGY